MEIGKGARGKVGKVSYVYVRGREAACLCMLVQGGAANRALWSN